MATTFIQIDGQTYEASSLNLPAEREFRDAWVKAGAGPQVTVDMDIARDIKIDNLVREADEAADAAERAQKRAAAKGDSAGAAAEEARKNRFRGVPDVAAQQVIANAANPAALAQVTLDEFLPAS